MDYPPSIWPTLNKLKKRNPKKVLFIQLGRQHDLYRLLLLLPLFADPADFPKIRSPSPLAATDVCDEILVRFWNAQQVDPLSNDAARETTKFLFFLKLLTDCTAVP